MLRHTILSTLGIVVMATTASAQSPASFFEQSSHDFGSVQRGPLLTHHYRLTNTSKSEVHISGARVSCGCVAAQAVKDTLAPGESTSIYATMDSRRFSGAKQVTIYVAFDRPTWQEVSLSISAYGRDDMAMDAETLSFGSVARGAPSVAKMNVTLRQPNWAVQGATSESAFVIPQVKELRRTQFEVVYEVSAELKPGLPTGTWTTDIQLTTNSPVAPKITMPASVVIKPALSVSPGEVTFNPTQVGQQSETKLVVKGGQPFRIKEIQGLDGTMTVADSQDESKPVHIITVKFDPTKEGMISRKLRIVTDLPTEGIAEVAIKGQATKKP
jgi:Protein of unknown function (DUF1573)